VPLLIWAAIAAAGARAQSFNVDFSELAGAPSPTYGAAAGQAGQWMTIPSFNSGGLFPLVDTSGIARPATIVPSLPNGPATFDHPATVGDDEALLDDYFDLRSAPTLIEVIGLDPGTYDVFVYTWAPDDGRFGTFVSIQGVDQGLIGGEWPGGLVEGITHSAERVTIGAGEPLGLNFFGITKGTLNGLQIVPVAPAPAGLAVIGAASVVAGGRRSRRL